MARILVTGAAGFIGRALCPALAARGHHVIAGLRRPGGTIAGAEPRLLGEIGRDFAWAPHLAGIEIAVHLAQTAHAAASDAALAAESAALSTLAAAMGRAGARRLVHLSSIKAMAEATPPGRPLREGDPARPGDRYGRAKLAGEQTLAEAAAASGVEFAILRPPLVYGPGARANFAALARLAGSGLPLPLAGLDNRRSLIGLDNLADLVAAAATHPAAAGRILLARDIDLSAPALVRLLAAALGRPARLFRLPGISSRAAARLPLLGPRLARLAGSLQVDDAATRARLGWTPPVPPEAALAAAARAIAGRSIAGRPIAGRR